jgi:hypothetical protein
LLPKDRWREALGDEVAENGPEVAIVCSAFTLSGVGKWLAWARSGPDLSASGPSGEVKGKVPASDPGEEMGALESHKLI